MEGFGTAAIIISAILLLLFGVFWIFALIDILKSKFKGGEVEKIIWVLVILFLPLIGLIIYYVIGRKNKIAAV